MTTGVQTTLWAKGRRYGGGDPPSVFDHCNHVYQAACVLWEVIEKPLAAATKMPHQELRSRVRPLLLISSILHDVLKANSAFQDMLAGLLRKLGQYQPVRHEILAAALIIDDRFWGKWLATSLDEREHWMVAWAVAGHHLQFRERRAGEANDPVFRTASVPAKIALHLGHQQVAGILRAVRGVLCDCSVDPGDVPALQDQWFDILDEDCGDGLYRTMRRFVHDARTFWRCRQHDEEFKRELALLKALLIAADVAGSALPSEFETEYQRKAWISDRINTTLHDSEIRQIYEDSLAGRQPHDFQRRVAASEHPVTIVTAGCGNGKTTAAYMWAERWAKGRKLFFTYPTTGTASAGFKDYLFTQTQLERALIHGRADVDMAAMFESSDIPPIERAQRLESLNAWGQQAIACTVDTVLGLIQNQRRPLFAFPAIAKGAFVFDEVHSYDRRMFAELLRFLKVFPGIPALIMSASIPPTRLEAIKEVAGEQMNPELIRPQSILGKTSPEEIKRYRLYERSEGDCWREVETVLAKNGGRNANKVLWVCNTVGSAIEVYRHAKQHFLAATVLLYHSRYRYKDRVCLQDQVINEFRYVDKSKTADKANRRRQLDRPAIIITTQVCEMSLDISADLLVTACCPLPSLVQRLGRLNRFATRDDPWPALLYPFSGRPYHEDDAPRYLEKAMEMVRELADNPCSQAMLAIYINELQSNEELPGYSAWLDGGWQSEPLPAREGDNSITLVRNEDLATVTRLPNGRYCRRDLTPLSIPMLFQRDLEWKEQEAGYPIATTGMVAYDWDDEVKQGTGAAWQNGNL